MRYRLPSKKRLTVWAVGLLLLLVLLPGALLMGLAWSLYERPQWLLPHINQYLAAQDIRIDELRLAPEGWDRLSFDYLKLDYQAASLSFINSGFSSNRLSAQNGFGNCWQAKHRRRPLAPPTG